MKLINLGNRGYREYKTDDLRFHAKWTDRQGVHSNYTVTDIQTGKTFRADTVAEIREAIRDTLLREEIGTDQPLLQIGDKLYSCRSRLAHEVEEPCTWEMITRRVTGVRIDGVELAGIGRIGWANIRRNYYRTPEAAITAFIAEQRNEIETAREKIVQADRAIVWAESLGYSHSDPR